MADPVEQIFLQSQAGSADGAGFGEFFQRGQEIEQQKQKLDIERQEMRIANATLGINRREEEAKQLLLLAESEQDTLFTQNYAYWISQGADKKHIPQLMGLVNGTTKGNKVVNDFFERVKGIREVKADEVQFKNMMDRVTAYTKKSGEVPSSVKFDSSGASVSFGGGDRTLTATSKDMRSLVKARLSGDTEAAKVFEQKLGLRSLSDRDQAVFDSKIRAIRQKLTALKEVLKSNQLADPEESVEALEEAYAKAREQELKLIQETYGIKPSDDASPNSDPNDEDINSDQNDELKLFSNE